MRQKTDIRVESELAILCVFKITILQSAMYIKVFVCRLQCGAVVHSAEEPVFHPKTSFYSTAGLTKIHPQISSLTFKFGKLKDFYNIKSDCMNQTKPKSADSAFYASSAVWTTPKIGKL